MNPAETLHHARQVNSTASRRWPPAATLARLLGLVAIVALLPYGHGPRAANVFDAWLGNTLILTGVFLLIGFLWLVVSGYFGYASARRDDWVALIPFTLALVIREAYARHSIQEMELFFYFGVFPNRHSIVQPLFAMFFQRLAADPYWFMMHVNGTLGAVAALPLYLFVRQRSQSRMAGVLAATFFALHPIIVQIAPTDGPYSLLLFAWFAGLAMLSADTIGWRQIVAGGVLLGIAATSRAEGAIYVLASLLLLDVGGLFAAVRRQLAAATLSATAMLGLVALHVYLCFPAHVAADEDLPSLGPVALAPILRTGLLSLEFNHPLFVVLVAIGAAAGVVDPRWRVDLGAALAAVLVGVPVSTMLSRDYVVVHRLVPGCAGQVRAAGVGAAWMISWLPPMIRRHWAAAIPAVAVALYVFAIHRHEVREPNGLSEEFWMLRDHLAPGGDVVDGCALLAVGRNMDTDICDLSQVLPGMPTIHCEQEDCERIVSEGGCFYYLRALNCFYAPLRLPPECRERGRTPAGDHFACMDPRCTELERNLVLSPVEERTVAVRGVFHGPPDSWPEVADIGLYRVTGINR